MGDSWPTGSEPFHLRQVQLVAGEAVDGGVEEFVVAEFAGDAVQEGEFGLAVVAGAAVEGDGFLCIVLFVPATTMDLYVAREGIYKVLVVPDFTIDEGADERGFRTGDQDEFRVHVDNGLVRKDAAGAHVAHHEVRLRRALNFNAIGGRCVDETEHAVFQVHIDDDAHVADLPDVVPGAEEDQVPFAQIAETFYRSAHPELCVGVVGQIHPELLEHSERESGAVIAVGSASSEPIRNSEERLGIVQHLVHQGLRGLRNGLYPRRRADPFLRTGRHNPRPDQVDGIHHRLRPLAGLCDFRRIRQRRDDRGVRHLHARRAPRDATRRDRQKGQ